jgi:hypothetical protein
MTKETDPGKTCKKGLALLLCYGTMDVSAPNIRRKIYRVGVADNTCWPHRFTWSSVWERSDR